MFSQTILAGRLGADPEVRSTGSGKKVASLRLCTQSSSHGKVYAEWHSVSAWGEGLVELIAGRLHKGDLVLVTGQLRTRSYGAGDAKRYATEVVMGPHDQIRFLSAPAAEAPPT